MKKLKVLHLSLKKELFDVMVTGEKASEYRKPSKWIESRLFNKDGSPKEYDVVKFVNRYGGAKPHFICEFLGAQQLYGPIGKLKYSNGLEIEVLALDYEILLGKIGITRNLK